MTKITKFLKNIITDPDFPKNKEMQVVYLSGIEKGIELAQRIHKGKTNEK